jgi:Heavy metal associated domain 2
MLPEAHITHTSKGRVRIKIPSRKGDYPYFSGLKDKLPDLLETPGIQRIEMNPTTGSILVIHELDFKATDFSIVSEFLEQKGLFKLGFNGSPGIPVSRNIARTFQDLNQQITGFTRGEIDLRSLALIGLIGLGLYQVSRGQLMIPAVSAFWYAATLMKEQSTPSADSNSEVNHKEG